jgi:putative colanic acid biosynthesis acetyltransferase WcaF
MIKPNVRIKFPWQLEINVNVWIGTNARLAPGTYVEKGVVVTLGSIASGNLKEWSIYSGFPAKRIKKRNL